MSSISGSVVDGYTKKPLAGIQITVMQNATDQSTGLVATTGSDGSFYISDSPYDDGDNSVYFAAADPSGKYGTIAYPFSGINNVKIELIPLQNTNTIHLSVLVGGIILLAVAGYFLFKKSK